MSEILMATLNARYIHSSLGLRYLRANLHELRDRSEICEFTIGENICDIAERILGRSPRVVALSVYIWNAKEVSELVGIIKKVAPHITCVVGGPEVSHLPHRVDFSHADYILKGEGERSFYLLCRDLLNDEVPSERVIASEPLPLHELILPYGEYTDEDIKNRVIYVEASRGCPFTCQFCLSSIDKRVRDISLESFLQACEELWRRGARNFKFIDRTFNLSIKKSIAILDFFLQRDEPYSVHFEVVPEHFPFALREKLALFPAGYLQLEVGIQTLNPIVAERIQRPLNFEKIESNLSFLENETKAHLHVDLIIGLPGESCLEFGDNLNRLASLTSCEIQVGILKKLSGTMISEHDEAFGMVYSSNPPYEVLQTGVISFDMMQEMKRFARFWDLYRNSGNFRATLPLIWADGDIYNNFLDLSRWVYRVSSTTWKLSLDTLAELLFKFSVERGLPSETVANALLTDYGRVPGRRLPRFLRDITGESAYIVPPSKNEGGSKMQKRQRRHSPS